MGRFLGSLFIIAAIISLILFTALDPEDREEYREGHPYLEPRDNQGSIYDHDFYAERDSEIRFTYNTDQEPISAMMKNRNTGNEILIESESFSTYFEHTFDSEGNYALRFENRQDQGTTVHYSLTTITKEDEGPRPFCGVFFIVFLILGIIFLARKKQKKGPSIIHARQMLYPIPPPSPGQGSHPPAPGHMDDLTPRSPFAPQPPPASTGSDLPQAAKKTEDDGTLPCLTMDYLHPGNERQTALPTSLSSAPPLSSPSPSSTPSPPFSSSPAGDQSRSLGYHDSRKPTQAFPMPKDSDAHESHFRCPDCGTVIFINREIKKVKCPKCSHTFRVEKQ